eukprot:scaffold4870_cov75-Skeletonema_dohrnii-CCMP3373.AAC.4
MWFEVAQPQWDERNRIAHAQGNIADRLRNARLAEKLVWYHQHRHELLPYHQQTLAKDPQTIKKMRPATRRAFEHHLDVAVREWENRKHNRESNQRSMTEYMDAPVPQSTRRQGGDKVKEANRQAGRRVLICEQKQPRIDTIFKRVGRPT